MFRNVSNRKAPNYGGFRAKKYSELPRRIKDSRRTPLKRRPVFLQSFSFGGSTCPLSSHCCWYWPRSPLAICHMTFTLPWNSGFTKALSVANIVSWDVEHGTGLTAQASPHLAQIANNYSSYIHLLFLKVSTGITEKFNFSTTDANN